MTPKTQTAQVRGKIKARWVILRLFDAGVSCTFSALPDDIWSITVKSENYLRLQGYIMETR